MRTATKQSAPETPLKGQYFIHPHGMVHFHCRGEGIPVLMLHGCGSLGEEMLRAFMPVDGLRIIAPDRSGYGLSHNFGSEPDGDPQAQAQTVARLLSFLGTGPVTVVAHSLGSAVALWLASDHPHLVRNVLFLAPFCRPSREAWLPLLRLAVAPVIGRAITEKAVPLLAEFVGRRIIRSAMHPHEVPSSLAGFPCRHAAHPEALCAAAAELRSFNASMERLARRNVLEPPAVAVFGSHDRTSIHAWHAPWLEDRFATITTASMAGVGHALHHAEPKAIAELLETMATGNDGSISPFPGAQIIGGRTASRRRQDSSTGN